MRPPELATTQAVPSGPSLRSRKRRMDVRLQAPADGRLTGRPAHLPELVLTWRQGYKIPTS